MGCRESVSVVTRNNGHFSLTTGFREQKTWDTLWTQDSQVICAYIETIAEIWARYRKKLSSLPTRVTTNSAHDPTSSLAPHFSSTMSVILVTLGTPCFKVYFPLQPKLQHSRCHHHSPLSQSPEELPQAMQQDLIVKIQHLALDCTKGQPHGGFISRKALLVLSDMQMLDYCMADI